MAKILLVDDDPALLRCLTEYLSRELYVVDTVDNGQEAVERLRYFQYDLIILDLGLPHIGGLDICVQYRQSGGKTPILILTGRNEIADKERGLDSGADDYLVKPFHLKELSARIRALLRRPSQCQSMVIRRGNIALDPATHAVYKNEKPLHLLPREYALLEFFMRNPDTIFSPETLVDRVWKSDSEVSPESIRTYITRVRAKIDDPGVPSMIQNIHGAGYRLLSNRGTTMAYPTNAMQPPVHGIIGGMS
jgi:DNA-binding response OmpR family regulator